MHVDEAIAQRRTHKVYDGSPLSEQTVRELLNAAIWAPNHKFTEPWRFAVILGESRIALGQALCEALDQMRKPNNSADAKLQAKQKKFQRRAAEAGAIIVVTYLSSPDNATLDREDYGATACAVQNMQLAATARGLVCQWSTSGVFNQPAVRDHLGLGTSESLVAALFVGRPTGALTGRRNKSVDDVTRWL
jgi:nitroreductase